MTNYKSSSEPRYRLGSTPRGDIIFHDGPRSIEIGIDTLSVGNFVEVTLFARSLRSWRYPYNADPLTEDIKKEILTVVSRLLEAKDKRARVKIKW